MQVILLVFLRRYVGMGTFFSVQIACGTSDRNIVFLYSVVYEKKHQLMQTYVFNIVIVA